MQETALSRAEDIPCSSLEHLHLPSTDPVAPGSDGGAATGTWPLLFINRAKETAAELYFKEANEAQYPLHLFPWPLVETSAGFKNPLHIKFFFPWLNEGLENRFSGPLPHHWCLPERLAFDFLQKLGLG